MKPKGECIRAPRAIRDISVFKSLEYFTTIKLSIPIHEKVFSPRHLPSATIPHLRIA